MGSAALDRVLAGLVVGLAATGLLSLRAGAPAAAWVFTVHALLGGALLAATAWKLARSVPRAARGRRWARLILGLVVSLLVVAALAGGFLWVVAGTPVHVGSWTVLTLHAWIGLAVVPLLVVHLMPHRWRLLRRSPTRPRGSSGGVSRRAVVAAGGLAAAGLALFGLSTVLERWRGGTRRFTGSRWLPAGGVPPPTTFYGEGPPAFDPGTWRLSVVGEDGRTRTFGREELRAVGELDVTAILDCTSGWALETGWRGVPLPAVLAAARVAVPARGSVRVTSVTGWATVLTADEARIAVLATGVAGAPLPIANGAPCRLIVPDRRGLDWVKWVGEIRVG
jgi:DMSO/TMAO reductase YedYZ molybdopterin-dependent catalytic subunit